MTISFWNFWLKLHALPFQKDQKIHKDFLHSKVNGALRQFMKLETSLRFQFLSLYDISNSPLTEITNKINLFFSPTQLFHALLHPLWGNHGSSRPNKCRNWICSLRQYVEAVPCYFQISFPSSTASKNWIDESDEHQQHNDQCLTKILTRYCLTQRV